MAIDGEDYGLGATLAKKLGDARERLTALFAEAIERELCEVERCLAVDCKSAVEQALERQGVADFEQLHGSIAKVHSEVPCKGTGAPGPKVAQEIEVSKLLSTTAANEEKGRTEAEDHLSQQRSAALTSQMGTVEDKASRNETAPQLPGEVTVPSKSVTTTSTSGGEPAAAAPIQRGLMGPLRGLMQTPLWGLGGAPLWGLATLGPIRMRSEERLLQERLEEEDVVLWDGDVSEGTLDIAAGKVEPTQVLAGDDNAVDTGASLAVVEQPSSEGAVKLTASEYSKQEDEGERWNQNAEVQGALVGAGEEADQQDKIENESQMRSAQGEQKREADEGQKRKGEDSLTRQAEEIDQKLEQEEDLKRKAEEEQSWKTETCNPNRMTVEEQEPERFSKQEFLHLQAEEGQRDVQDEARKRKTEEEERRKAEEGNEQRMQVEEERQTREAGEENQRLTAKEEQRRKVQEEDQHRKAAEEQRRKTEVGNFKRMTRDEQKFEKFQKEKSIKLKVGEKHMELQDELRKRMAEEEQRRAATDLNLKNMLTQINQEAEKRFQELTGKAYEEQRRKAEGDTEQRVKAEDEKQTWQEEQRNEAKSEARSQAEEQSQSATSSTDAATKQIAMDRVAHEPQPYVGDKPLWIVVGGEDTKGIVVRRRESLQSERYAFRLKTGSTIEELDVVGNRLHYRRIRGDGPDFGWVSMKDKERPLLLSVPKNPT